MFYFLPADPARGQAVGFARADGSPSVFWRAAPRVLLAFLGKMLWLCEPFCNNTYTYCIL